MKTTHLLSEEPGALQRVTEILKAGGIVAFPTDTVYGVGAHAFMPVAVARLYTVKRRPASVPIPVLLSSAEDMKTVCTDIPAQAWALAERFWPGALSLILRRSAIVPDEVTAGRSTVAVRVPDHALVRELCRNLDAPLAASSANRHENPPACCVEDVLVAFGGHIDAILDGGPCPGGVASTILDLTHSPAVIRRAGPITAGQLSEFLDQPVPGARD